MHSKLSDLIKNARRELRRADGVPMTAEELEEERHAQELKSMEGVVYGRIPVSSLFPLEGKVVIYEGKVIASFSIDERRFPSSSWRFWPGIAALCRDGSRRERDPTTKEGRPSVC